ncbi:MULTISPECIES: glycosyltransferase [unclassified Microbacterium]|uniref:glycosyltransferase n=1 Tax=unclassified Microbacterium TaxID=2609290 RepID=UPI00214B05D2|nr:MULTISPECIES: glycosyltransferase [unclassified Microbacterium]MCR2808990.1 glycosyltransferase [Microbacterium sp. zg.B185]WIM18597.1 glycosyltransferase [Microbacterium sp. zg-B185]
MTESTESELPESVPPKTEFPDAEYLILSSRLIPDRDGGYALAALARARQMAAAGVHGGLGPLLLTLDPGTPAEHAQHRAAFAGRDLVVDPRRMRNLFDEAADPRGGAAPWLRRAAHPGEPDPALTYYQVTDAAGRPVVGLPVIDGDPDWHVATAPVAVYDGRGGVVGVVDGFGALYRAWLDSVVTELRAGRADRPVVVLCESRQLGELLAGWEDPALRLVHAIHTIHLEPPFTPDAPLNELWSRWFGLAERFDAVLWPTAAQRDDVEDRFGTSPVHVVVPNAVPPAASVAPLADRVPGRILMLNRLAPGKRIDAAIRALAAVRRALPDATLDIYGDGPERDRLQQLIDELGLDAHVVLRGLTDDPGRALDEASVFLSTSAFEGQGLSIAEALVHGCPVVAFDVRYGPRDLLAQGGGMLVPDGDEDALAAALVEVLTNVELRARLTAEAVAAGRTVHPAHAMAALAQAVQDVLARPSRRVGG